MFNPSIVIRTVSSKRKAYLDRLMEQLAPLEFVVSDKVNPQSSYIDDWFAAMSMGIDNSKEWLIHLEDDAYLSPDWHYRVPRLLDNIPKHIHLGSFYSGKRMKEELKNHKNPYFEFLGGGSFYMHQCTFWRMSQVPYFLDGITSQWAKHPEYKKNDFIDQALMDFLKQEKKRFARVFPSLVQHTGDISLVGHHKSKNRESPSFRHFYGEVNAIY